MATAVHLHAAVNRHLDTTEQMLDEEQYRTFVVLDCQTESASRAHVTLC